MTLSTEALYTAHLKVIETLDESGIPQPYNGPAVETYGDTPQDAFRQAEELLVTNNWASILVVALEEKDYIPTPMEWLNMVFTHPDLD